jgi:transposase
MIQLDFFETEIDALYHERFHHPHPHVQKKMEALYLKSQGLTHNEICRLVRITRATLSEYLKQYKKGGIEKLKELNFNKPQSELQAHNQTIEMDFKQQPPQSVVEAQDRIEKLTGIRRSPTQIRAFMEKLGMKFLKVGHVPGKSCEPDKLKEQETFEKDQLQPRLQQARQNKRTVLFMDAAHFVYGAFLGYLWCFCRIFIASPAGRQRFNVLGALNAVTHEIITVTNQTYINAQSVCDLLFKIATMYIDVPITIVLDNARYQKCEIIRNVAKQLNIELLYLPSYSPQLNLIERFWKFVKKECLYSKYYHDYKQFENAIVECIKSANTKHKNKLESLITWNFQSFKNVQIMTV